ncbi:MULTISPECIES: nitroreductase family protein [Oceanobacillus]|uniref:Nitroreductase n=1 Tax=Oceanobacillus caeni TaxID=405946 RepID=A0ABR5MNP8_9BACI|nr:nitroreductase [Oceanobacillus caeni]KPH78772.1 nitroreductase [Oceanobacillus caeni]MBU8790248.1 nitroreductase [Oceanobacillus caeni]
MDILEGIKRRRSIHSFKEEQVSKEILEQIFTYGSYAPTHYMKEPWKIKVYQGDGRKKFVQSIMKSYQRIGMIKDDDHPKTLKTIDSLSSFLLAIPHHAVIYYEQPDDRIRNEEEYASICAFIQNSQLAAWQFGVGMLWTITPYMHDPQFAKEIGLENEKIKIAAVMQIGYPKKIPIDKGRTPIGEKMEFVEF